MQTYNKHTILLVDDHAVVRAGFKLLLQSHNNVKEIFDASCGEEVIKKYQEHKPDIVVMDLSMPGIGGFEAIRRLTSLDKKAIIVVYSIHDERIYVDRALEAGAKGYITKNSAPEILNEAINQVIEQGEYIEERLKAKINYKVDNKNNNGKSNIEKLSNREFDVFLLLAKGKDAHAVSKELHLSYKTISNYSSSIKNKLNITTYAELANLARSLKLISYD